MDKSFHSFIQSDKYAEPGKPCNMGIKRLSNKRNHVFRHFQIGCISFRFHRILFRFGAMLHRAEKKFRLLFQL